jgi:hypothetical protein
MYPRSDHVAGRTNAGSTGALARLASAHEPGQVKPGKVNRWYVSRDSARTLCLVAHERNNASIPRGALSPHTHLHDDGKAKAVGELADVFDRCDVQAPAEVLALISGQRQHDRFSRAGHQRILAFRRFDVPQN